MGCHTWFYKKSNLKIEVARERLIKEFKKSIDFNKKIIDFYTKVNIPFSEIFKDDYEHDNHYTSERTYEIAEEIFGDATYLEMLESYPEWDINFCSNQIKIKKRQIRMIEKHLCNCAVYNKMNGVYIKDKKTFYVDTNEFHDLFRKYGYPSDILYSYDATIKYIENKDNQCTTYDFTLERLKDFWEKYPDGQIHFG